MRFAFIADVPGWACHRQGMGLVKYGATEEHTWSLFHAEPRDFTPERLRDFDAIRVSTAPLFVQLVSEGVLPVPGARKGQKLIFSLASFQDVERTRNRLARSVDLIAAFAIVDHRLVEHCAGYGKPILPYIDRTDHEVFYREDGLVPHGPKLRAGWAGSVKAWGQVKHVDVIERACELAGVEFVRQDRELDGQKGAEEMRRWYCGLDLYLTANDPETPTPVSQLEAASCGVPIVTTRCGILWPLLAPWQIVDRAGSVDGLSASLITAAWLGREELAKYGEQFASEHSYFLHWRHDVAEQHTLDVAALLKEA